MHLIAKCLGNLILVIVIAAAMAFIWWFVESVLLEIESVNYLHHWKWCSIVLFIFNYGYYMAIGFTYFIGKFAWYLGCRTPGISVLPKTTMLQWTTINAKPIEYL